MAVESIQAPPPAAGRYWVGAQVGCTLGLGLLGLDVHTRGHEVGESVLTLAVTANVLGWIFWKRRERTGWRGALIRLVVVTGIASLLGLLMIDLAGLSFFELGYLRAPRAWPRWVLEVLGGGYFLILAYPIAALLISVRQYRG